MEYPLLLCRNKTPDQRYMNNSKKRLLGILAISSIVALYSIYIGHFAKHDNYSDINANWEKNWSEYYCSVELASSALWARLDGRTNDFECLLADDLFDKSLKEAIRFYDHNGHRSQADKILKVYVYRCVIDLAANPSPPNSPPHSNEIIDLLRKIATLQSAASTIPVDPEIETNVAEYIARSIRESEATNLLQGVTNAPPYWNGTNWLAGATLTAGSNAVYIVSVLQHEKRHRQHAKSNYEVLRDALLSEKRSSHGSKSECLDAVIRALQQALRNFQANERRDRERVERGEL